MINRKLAYLHEGAGIVAGGDLNYRIHDKGHDEFAELAKSINFVTTNLQSFTQKLESEIHVRKETEEDLIEAKLTAETASRAKSEFLSSMSHELRTPLNAILGFGQLLESDPDHPLADVQTKSVQHILNGGHYLLGLIDQLLDLAKIEEGNFDLVLEDVKISEIVSECLIIMEPLAERAGIKTEVQIGCALNYCIRVDRMRFKQVLLNLLSNAVKYNSPGGRITVSWAALDLGVAKGAPEAMHRIMVVDTGDGIPENRRQDVFQPFERLGQEAGLIEGTGIGLSISRRLVELMDGVIDFKSQEGQGTTFWVDLPVSKAENGTFPAEPAAAVEIDASSTAKYAKTSTVLYVEDNPANVILMEQVIRRLSNLTLISVHTAEIGLEMARRRRPEIIIMDVNLPGMNGLEALACLRELDETRDIPVIALSADAMPAQVAKGLEAGFSHYLTKPLKIPELIETIGSIVEPS